jgi:hypothetical protein
MRKKLGIKGFLYYNITQYIMKQRKYIKVTKWTSITINSIKLHWKAPVWRSSTRPAIVGYSHKHVDVASFSTFCNAILNRLLIYLYIYLYFTFPIESLRQIPVVSTRTSQWRFLQHTCSTWIYYNCFPDTITVQISIFLNYPLSFSQLLLFYFLKYSPLFSSICSFSPFSWKKK